MELLVDTVPSPIGDIYLVTDGTHLCALDFVDCDRRFRTLLHKRFETVNLIPTPNPTGLSDRLRAYFNGDLTSFDDVLVRTDGSKFQQQVWQSLRAIPAGQTLSYGELAARLGHPDACRAVGRTNGLNPISIALPCHRVIGANGKLTGYAGGIERKRWLLHHEGALLPAGAVEPKSETGQLSLLH
ncbi:MAG: methylated-DNA--[protein]-cysteine S-methyltransferase [Cyanobacteria bacterium P01_D01_bin.123]